MPTMPPGTQSSIAAQRYWLLTQEPIGRLRTTTPSKPRCNMMRTCACWVAAYGLARRQLDRLPQGGHSLAELTRRCLTGAVQRSENLLLRRRDPVVSVIGDAVVGEQLHEPAVLGPQELRRRGCVGDPRHRWRRDPEGAPHRVEPDHAMGLVERGLHRCDRRVTHPGQRREEHRHRIRGMQRHDRIRNRRDVIGSRRGNQTMPTRQPSTSFSDRDASRSHGSMMTERDQGIDSQRPTRHAGTRGSGAGRAAWPARPFSCDALRGRE